MDFVITGEIKPYVRMTRRGKWGSPQAREYLASKAAIQMQLRAQMAGREPFGREPLSVRLWIRVSERLHTKDLDNQIKAILDACNTIVWADDRWIDDISAVRYMDGHPDGALAQMEVEPIAGA
jgi:Holliday junction resolvase RusA-like endonuclease